LTTIFGCGTANMHVPQANKLSLTIEDLTILTQVITTGCNPDPIQLTLPISSKSILTL
jgi:hypothetical protein